MQSSYLGKRRQPLTPRRGGAAEAARRFKPVPLCPLRQPRFLQTKLRSSSDVKCVGKFVVRFSNVLQVRNGKLVRDDLWIQMTRVPARAHAREASRDEPSSSTQTGCWVVGRILNPGRRFWSAVRKRKRRDCHSAAGSSQNNSKSSTEDYHADIVIDCGGSIACAGFIDIQLNGAFGVDFTDPSCTQADVHRVSRGILAHGVTSYLPTVITSPKHVYHKVLPVLASACKDIKATSGVYDKRTGMFPSGAGANAIGMHLEGPFIHPRKKGAHQEKYIVSPTEGMTTVRDVYGYLNGVRMVTLAPELPGAMPVIRGLSTMGVAVSLGHTTTSLDTAQSAMGSGARLITHLFNAMSSFHHRDPGLIGMLASGESGEQSSFWYGIIVDGIHTHPSAVKLAYNTHPKGAVLVTDAMAAMGLPEGKYRLGGLEVEVVEEEEQGSRPRTERSVVNSPRSGKLRRMSMRSGHSRKRATLAGSETLAGSVVTMDSCVRNYVDFTGCSVAVALESASLHPARALGLDGSKGSLEHGKDADIVLLDPNTLEVQATFVSGVPLYASGGWEHIIEAYTGLNVVPA